MESLLVCKTLPMTTCPTSWGSTPERLIAPLVATTARSVAVWLAKPPPYDPNGVRAPDRMTSSLLMIHCLFGIYQYLDNSKTSIKGISSSDIVGLKLGDPPLLKAFVHKWRAEPWLRLEFPRKSWTTSIESH